MQDPASELRRIHLPRTSVNRPRERLAGFPEGAEGATIPNLFGPARSGGLVPKGARLLLFGEVASRPRKPSIPPPAR